MTVFDPHDCSFTPRADMYLPNKLLAMSIVFDIAAVVCLVMAFTEETPALGIGVLLFAILGVCAFLCWKNQSIRILDAHTFEYTTFLGEKREYRFADIERVRRNADSMTLYVGGDKVHIESMVYISTELTEKFNEALAKKP